MSAESIIRRVQNDVADEMRDTVEVVSRPLRRSNPVDTGRSRGGWTTGVQTGPGRTVTGTISNAVRYTGYIRRAGTNEPRGEFIRRAVERALPGARITWRYR